MAPESRARRAVAPGRERRRRCRAGRVGAAGRRQARPHARHGRGTCGARRREAPRRAVVEPDPPRAGLPPIDRDGVAAPAGRAAASGRSPVVSGDAVAPGRAVGSRWVVAPSSRSWWWPAIVVGVVGVPVPAGGDDRGDPAVEPVGRSFDVTRRSEGDRAGRREPRSCRRRRSRSRSRPPTTSTATGGRSTETKATGTVTFSNCDPTSANTIPAGTRRRDRDGIGSSRPRERQFLPSPTSRSRLHDRASTGDVGVTAVEPGTAGNVAAGTITVVPTGRELAFIKVTQPRAPTTGGTRTEKPSVSQKDVDAALGRPRRPSSTTQFDDAVGRAGRRPAGPDPVPRRRQSLGDAVPTPTRRARRPGGRRRSTSPDRDRHRHGGRSAPVDAVARAAARRGRSPPDHAS